MRIYIVIGPSGVGKTTIGKMLSERLALPYYDADDFHSEENMKKMNRGIGLTDADRLPWLMTLSRNIKRWHKDQGAVLACSALKEVYREKLVSIPPEDITWIYLHGDEELIKDRLFNRKQHFFNQELLKSQYADLEVPEYGCHINVNKSPDKIIDEILLCIKQKE